MLPRRPHGRLAVSLALALPVVAVGCSGKKSSTAEAEAIAAVDARMPAPKPEVFAAPAGFIAGGLAYVALRPGRLQRWWQSLPLPPEVVEELAAGSRELGVDLRTGDVLGHFGIDPEGVVSMTIARPLVGDGEALLDALAELPPRKPDALPIPDAPPGLVPGMSPELVDRLGAVGFHIRIHLPVVAPERLTTELQRLAAREVSPSLCRDLGPNLLCAGDSESLTVVRGIEGALVADIVVTPARLSGAADRGQRPVVEEALRAATVPAPIPLRGDLAVFVDTDPLRDLYTAVTISDTAQALRWSSEPGPMIAEVKRQGRVVDQLRETRRLFRGIRWEVTVGADVVRSTFAWEPRDAEAAATLDKALVHRGPVLPAPTLDSLCTASLFCLRMGGLPSLGGLGELATGVYAGTPEAFGELMSDAGPFGGLVIALETWPNLLGASERWTREELRGPEAVILGQVLSSLDNFAGLGGSLRRLEGLEGSGQPTVDFAAYMRLTAAELGIVRGALALAQQRLQPVEVPGVAGKVESLALSEQVRSGLYVVTEPTAHRHGDRELEVGWAVAADTGERLAWLLGQPRDATQEPAFYLEFPDLGGLFSTIPDADRELGSSRAWLGGRSFRLAVDVTAGRPRIDAYLGKPGS